MISPPDPPRVFPPTETDHEPPPPYGGAQGAAHRFAQDLVKARYTKDTPEVILGKGGIGQVVVAHETLLRRPVAMKTLLPKNQTAEHHKERLIREARITGILEHPSIVPVHDIGENERGEIFFTMKKVEGLTLGQIIKKLSPSSKEITAEEKEHRSDVQARFGILAARLEIIQKVCDAIAFAHSHPLRVVHRDLKPDNIMVGRFGEVLVMDWGLAKVLGKGKTAEELRQFDPEGEDSDPTLSPGATPPFGLSFIQLSQEGQFNGTLLYAAPEQIEGRQSDIDEHCDIYALGGILYHLLTLEPPLPVVGTKDEDENGNAEPLPSLEQRDRQMASIKAVLHMIENRQTIPRVHCGASSGKDKRIPESLRPLIKQALEPDPAKRIQSVTEFKQAITLYQSGFANSFENAGPWKHFTYFVGRHKAVSITTAAALLIVGGLSVAFTRKVQNERNMKEEALEAKNRANIGLLAQTELAEKNAKSALEAQGRAEGVAKEKENETKRANEALEETKKEKEKADKQAEIAERRLSDSYLDAGLKFCASGDNRQGVAFLCASLRADPKNRVAAARLTFELQYRDWLLPKGSHPFPAELIDLDVNLDETGARRARFKNGAGDIELTTLTNEGTTGRIFNIKHLDGTWTKTRDERKQRKAEDSDPIPGFPEYGKMKEEYDFVSGYPFVSTDGESGYRFVSTDGKWAVEIDRTEAKSLCQPLNLLHLPDRKEVVLQESKEGHNELAGIPVFDATKPVVWLHSDFSFVEQKISEKDNWFYLEGIELPSGRRLVDKRLRLESSAEDARPPKISRNGRQLVTRYVFPNRSGEELEVVSLEENGDGTFDVAVSSRHLLVPGTLNDVSDDGNDMLVLTPKAAVVYALSRRPAKLGKSRGGDDVERLPPEFHRESLNFDAVSPDGLLQAKATREGTIRISKNGTNVDLAKIESKYVPLEGGRSIHHVEFSPDSHWLMVWGASSGDGSTDTEIYDALSGRMIFPRFCYDDEFGASEVQHFLSDAKRVKLVNGETLLLVPPNAPTPSWFIDLVEELAGGYVSDNGIFSVIGNDAPRLPRSLEELVPKGDDSLLGFEWAKLISERFGQKEKSRP